MNRYNTAEHDEKHEMGFNEHSWFKPVESSRITSIDVMLNRHICIFVNW